MTNLNEMRMLRSSLAHIDDAAWHLQRAADVAHQSGNHSRGEALEMKIDDLQQLRRRIESDLRQLETQAFEQTKVP